MDLQTLAKNHKPTVLHLEVTSICNLSCPQCDRESPELFDKSLQTELSLQRCKELFDEDFIRGLNKVYMCGDFGDPCAAKDTLEIFEYFRQVNPKIYLGLNTNGSVKSVEWWSKLGKLFNKPYDYVEFGIDGLEDTNHIYRKTAKWNKIINNATAFIKEGGYAHWSFLVFKHNEHQIDEARDLAKKLGFSWFYTKVSNRFKSKPVDFLDPPTGFKENTQEPSSIDCYVLKEQSIYVNSQGKILPCCWFGRHSYISPLARALASGGPINNELQWYLNDWTRISNSWLTDKPAKICLETCGVVDNDSTLFKNMWTQKIELTNL